MNHGWKPALAIVLAPVTAGAGVWLMVGAVHETPPLDTVGMVLGVAMTLLGIGMAALVAWDAIASRTGR